MRIFVTGTDTDVGKTVFSAALAGALNAHYWKPIQAGCLDRSDSDVVRMLSGLPNEKILPEACRLKTPCSPHQASEIDGVTIECDALQPPALDPLIVEGAGGLMVPVTRDVLIIDLIARWKLSTVLVARTALGTINHSLLSLEALAARKIPVLGVAFVGDPNPESEGIICAWSGVRRLGRMPMIAELDRRTIARAFADKFSIEEFQ